MFETFLQSNKSNYCVLPAAVRSCRTRSNDCRVINCGFVTIHERIRKNSISHPLNLQTYVKDGYNCKTNAYIIVIQRLVYSLKKKILNLNLNKIDRSDQIFCLGLTFSFLFKYEFLLKLQNTLRLISYEILRDIVYVKKKMRFSL